MIGTFLILLAISLVVGTIVGVITQIILKKQTKHAMRAEGDKINPNSNSSESYVEALKENTIKSINEALNGVVSDLQSKMMKKFEETKIENELNYKQWSQEYNNNQNKIFSLEQNQYQLLQTDFQDVSKFQNFQIEVISEVLKLNNVNILKEIILNLQISDEDKKEKLKLVELQQAYLELISLDKNRIFSAISQLKNIGDKNSLSFLQKSIEEYQKGEKLEVKILDSEILKELEKGT
jgi:hypothetical protein